MKYLYRVLFITLSASIILLSGIYSGARIQADYESKIFGEMEYQSDAIAVVNQDLGVEYGEEHINFSQNIIETLGDGYVLVSKAAGESGLQDGSYAALVSFPGGFSRQLSRINDMMPEKASFVYQLSPKLSQKAAIEALIRIRNLERDVNETISFMYASSVLGELHGAQSTTNKLLYNNEQSFLAARHFTGVDLSGALNIDYMEREYPELEYPDFNEYIQGNSDVLDDLNEEYRSLTETMQTDYSALLADAAEVINGTSTISDAIGAVNILSGEGGNPFDEAVTQAGAETQRLADEAAAGLDEDHEALSSALNEFLNPAPPPEPTATEGNLPEPAAGLRELEIPEEDECLAKIDGIITGFVDYLANTGYFNNPEDEPKDDDDDAAGAEPDEDVASGGVLDGEVQKVTKELRELSVKYAEKYLLKQLEADKGAIRMFFSGAVSEYIEKLKQDSAARQEAELLMLQGLLESLQTSITERQESVKGGLLETYTQTQSTLLEMNTNYSSFNPTQYIYNRQDSIGDITSRFSDNNSDWAELVSKAVDERSELLFNAYENYDQYVMTLQESMTQVVEDGNAQLRQNQDLLLAEQTEANTNNTELVGLFGEKLANTRIGSQPNTNFISFMVSPIKTIELGDGSQKSFMPPEMKAVSNIIRWLPVVLALLAGCFVLISTSWFILRAIVSRHTGRARET